LKKEETDAFDVGKVRREMNHEVRAEWVPQVMDPVSWSLDVDNVAD
jgi:hypothetical protein